jgi:site-specific DNA-cytosine methylase
VIDPYMEAHWRHDRDGDVWVEAGPLGKTSQVRMCGNAVPPDVVAALVQANLAEPPRILRAA